MIEIGERPLTLADVEAVARQGAPVRIAQAARARMRESRAVVGAAVEAGRVVYGVNTGFGPMKDHLVAGERLRDLQLNLLRSHQAGVGAETPRDVVRAMLLLRAVSLALGHSGCRPDVVEGLTRLKRRYIIGTCSNANIGLAVRMAKHSGLPWDTIVGAEVARAYKPTAQAYLGTAAALNLEPHEVMLVAAHNSDLAAASKTGFRTAFVARPDEYGPKKKADVADNTNWDISTDSFNGVADAMGCPRL